jgi:hypothetical protein
MTFDTSRKQVLGQAREVRAFPDMLEEIGEDRSTRAEGSAGWAQRNRRAGYQVRLEAAALQERYHV